MQPGRSHNKGNSFQNYIAKLLSLWLTHNKRADVLDSSPGSGAKATAHRKAGRSMSSIEGDLIAVSPEGYHLTEQFVLELKHQNATNLNTENLVFKTSNQGITSYWQILLDICQANRKLPILIFRQNNRAIQLCLCKEGIEKFQCQAHVHLMVKLPNKNLYMVDFNIFLKHVNPACLSPVSAKPKITKIKLNRQV